MKNEVCSLCKKNVKDLKVQIIMDINTKRKREDSIWETIPNLSELKFAETLCLDCFDIFAEKLKELNSNTIELQDVNHIFSHIKED